MLESHEWDAFISQCFIINIKIYILTFHFRAPLICSLGCSKCWHLKVVVPFLLLALVPLEQTDCYIWTVFISHASTGFFHTQEIDHAKNVCLKYLSITCGLEYFLTLILSHGTSPSSVKILWISSTAIVSLSPIKNLCSVSLRKRHELKNSNIIKQKTWNLRKLLGKKL